MSANDSKEGSSAHGVFATTHWSVVLSAQQPGSPDSGAALERLCRTYWYPLYAYARKTGQDPADAEDLTQGFFFRLLQKDYLRTAAREKGRFRTFLLTAFKAFMANEWDRSHAGKRGGFSTFIALDPELAESRFTAEPPHRVQPDVLFDRHWAVTLLDLTMARLKEEYVSSGRARLFEVLQSCLVRQEKSLPYSSIANTLNVTEPAVKMAVHRLRTRYRELLEDEIAQTVSSPDQVEEELRYLFACFER
jgi:RNA polymerase sigma factor (sigma-70 family)